MTKYRIKVYDRVEYEGMGRYKKYRKYMPQELNSFFWGLFTCWEDISEYSYYNEEDAEIVINEFKLRDEVRKSKNITYINK